jgi:hypothetical protein
MKYPLAVLLLKLADQSGTPFDPDYARRFFTRAGQGTRNLVDFYLDMSHGQADLGDSEVFGWLDVPHTVDELAAYHQQVKDDETRRLNDENIALPEDQKLSSEQIEEQAARTAHSRRRAKIKEWAREAATAQPEPVDLARFVTFVAVFSSPVDYFGSTEGVVINHNPGDEEKNSVDLTGVAHEVGHGLGLTHSRREGAVESYGDLWDIMSAYKVRYNHAGSHNEDPDRPYHTYGPGLNVVNMQIQGWLDLSRVYTFPTTGAGQVTLRPLHRRDLEGYLAARVGQLWIEFRMNELWDSATEGPVVLLHRRSASESGMPCSSLVMTHEGVRGELGGPRDSPRPDLRDGEAFRIGNELDIDSDFLRISVDIDAEAREATVYVVHRVARQLEPALPTGGVTTDGGGMIWTPGRGWVRVPPRSPLYAILEQIAEIEQLQALSAVPAQHAAITGMTTQRLAMVREDVSRIIADRLAPKVPGASLLAKLEEG